MIDHLVYTTPHFHQTIQQIETQFGIPPTYGGKHLEQGTHNALLNLGNGCYFEILAIDPDNKKIPAPRWMGVDLVQSPTLTRWAIKSEELLRDAEILKAINPELAKTKTGMRERSDGTILNWELSIPLPSPEIEAIPFLLDWKDSPHPTGTLPQHCELINFYVEHPQPEEIRAVFKKLNTKVKVEQGIALKLIAEIMTPNGKIILS